VKEQEPVNFTVLDLLSLELKEQNDLKLRCVAGRAGLNREITVPDLNRPGLALAGFYDSFAWERLQIFGRGENAYINKIEADGVAEQIYEKLFSYQIP